MSCPAVFVAIIFVQAKPPSRVPNDAISFPVVRVGMVELPVKVIDVASEVIDRLPAVFKHFTIVPVKMVWAPEAVAPVSVTFLPSKVLTISKPSTFSKPLDILQLPTTAIEVSNFYMWDSLCVVFWSQNISPNTVKF